MTNLDHMADRALGGNWTEAPNVLAIGLQEIRNAIAALGATAQQAEPLVSIELAQTAKLTTTVAVKCRGMNARATADETMAIYDELVSRYAPKDGAP